MNTLDTILENRLLEILSKWMKNFQTDPRLIKEICKLVSSLPITYKQIKTYHFGFIYTLKEFKKDKNSKLRNEIEKYYGIVNQLFRHFKELKLDKVQENAVLFLNYNSH